MQWALGRAVRCEEISSRFLKPPVLSICQVSFVAQWGKAKQWFDFKFVFFFRALCSVENYFKVSQWALSEEKSGRKQQANRCVHLWSFYFETHTKRRLLVIHSIWLLYATKHQLQLWRCSCSWTKNLCSRKESFRFWQETELIGPNGEVERRVAGNDNIGTECQCKRSGRKQVSTSGDTGAAQLCISVPHHHKNCLWMSAHFPF